GAREGQRPRHGGAAANEAACQGRAAAPAAPAATGGQAERQAQGDQRVARQAATCTGNQGKTLRSHVVLQFDEWDALVPSPLSAVEHAIDATRSLAWRDDGHMTTSVTSIPAGMPRVGALMV